MERRHILSPTLLVFLASLLLQAAWIAAVPPYRGSDEFDHAYRADAVAHGQWVAPPEPAKDGRGALLVVRRSIVDSARTMCASYEYTGPDNCRAVESVNANQVTVASAASSYHPAFYWLIGTPARLANGANALLLMRLTAALLCSLMLSLAMHLTSFARPQSMWTRVALLVGATPVLMYSTSVAAPNGLEIAAGAAVWTGLLALGAGSLSRGEETRVLSLASAAAVVLVTLRPVGPLWLTLIMATCYLLFRPVVWHGLVVRRRHAMASAGLLVGVGIVSSTLWVRAADGVALQESHEYSGAFAATAAEIPLWVFQSIAAFPLRNEPAPLPVYAIYLLIGLIGLGTALVNGSKRVRLAVIAVGIAAVAVPFLITLAVIDREGTFWQGRYGLPYSIGILLVGSLGMHGLERLRFAGRILVAVALMVTVAHVWSVLYVATRESLSPYAFRAEWWPLLPNWVIGGLAIAACGLGSLAVLNGSARAAEDEPPSPTLRETASTLSAGVD